MTLCYPVVCCFADEFWHINLLASRSFEKYQCQETRLKGLLYMHGLTPTPRVIQGTSFRTGGDFFHGFVALRPSNTLSFPIVKLDIYALSVCCHAKVLLTLGQKWLFLHHARGISLIRISVWDLFRTKRCLRIFDEVFLKTKRFCQRWTRYRGSEIPLEIMRYVG